MDPYIEFKQMEGARIQPLLAAVSALPGAALVLSSSQSGAPLFVMALALIAASYLFWMCSDSVFGSAYIAASASDPSAGQVTRAGYYLSWGCLLYGMASLACTTAGFAAVHSTLRSPISVDVGFLIVFGLIAAVMIHCAHSVYLRNKLSG